MTISSPSKQHHTALKTLWQEAFGDTEEYVSLFFATAFSSERCRILTEQEPVTAALYWFDCRLSRQRLAYIYAVATKASHRGRGLCHKLMTETHEQLKSLGYSGCILVPGTPELFRFYETMGYKTFGRIKEYSCHASNRTVPLTSISPEEFAACRRDFLPPCSVIQENESLLFLSKQARFYRGADFLLTARQEGTRLYGTELLGNPSRTSDILHTLGCTEGTFRTPGTATDRPFAMYVPIKKDGIPPAYFGFAFD